MRFRLSFLVPIFVCAVSVFSILYFKPVPSSKIWNGYNLLFSSNETGLTDSILEESGCTDFISKSKQEDNTFDLYFKDADNKFDIFYIPEKHSKSLEIAVKLLKKENYTVGVDGEGSFSIKIPIYCCLFFILLLTLSIRKVHFFFGGLFFVLLTYARPFSMICVSSCFGMFGMFILQRFWKYKIIEELEKVRNVYVQNGIQKVISSFLARQAFLSVLVFIFIPVIVLLFSSVSNSLFYFFTLIASFSALVIVDCFVPFFVLLSNKNVKRIISCFVLAFVFVLGMKFATDEKKSDSSIVSSSAQPNVPTPFAVLDASKVEFQLPRLEDKILSVWKEKTSPYRKLNLDGTIAFEGDDFSDVKITEYSEVNGLIVPEEKILFSLNDDFKNSVFENLKSKNSSFIENLLLFQKNSVKDDFYVSYSKAVGVISDDFNVYFLCVYLLILLVFASYHLFINLKCKNRI